LFREEQITLDPYDAHKYLISNMQLHSEHAR